MKINFPSKETIIAQLLQLLIVAFGVFFALIVNDWSASQNQRSLKEKTVELLISELEFNRTKLESSIEYHLNLKKELPLLAKELDQKRMLESILVSGGVRFNQLPSWNGPGLVGLETAVYDGAIISGVFSTLDIQKLQAISGVYSKQKEYIRLSESVINKLLSMNSETKNIDMIILLELLVNDMTLLEKSLVSRIQTTIQILTDKN